MNSIATRRAQPILSQKEIGNYSIIRAICASMEGGLADGLEVEASRACKLRLGGHGNFAVPADVMFDLSENGRRTMTAGVPADGGYTIGTEVRPLAAYLWDASGIMQLGANMIGGLEQDIRRGGDAVLPSINSAVEAEWVAEGSAPSADQSPGFGMAQAKPKRIVASLKISKQWLVQSGPDAENYVRAHLMGALGASIDRGAVAGTGGVKPIGLLYKPGVTTVSLGTDGAALSLAKLAEVEDGLISGRFGTAGAGYAISAATRKKAKQIQKASGTSSFLLETCEGVDYLNGFPAFASTFLPDNLTKGSGTSLGSLVFGRFSFLDLFFWNGADIVSDQFTYKKEGLVEVTISVLADIATAKPAAFVVVKDVLNS